MCGLTGFVLREGAAEGQGDRLRAMTDVLEHRGPDDAGHVLRGPVGFGFRRLSIIDLAGGHQPIEDPSGVLGMGNGEIYNFRDLRGALESEGARFQTGSDIETILHVYERRLRREGADLCELPRALVGMFAFALADFARADAPRLVLGRDRLGIKPLYWAETAEGIFFGSEPKALLASGAFPRELRREALLDYLVQGYVGGPESAWVGIHRLPPGCVLEWTAAEGVRIHRYWDLPCDVERAAPEPGEILELLDRVVEDRLVAEVPLGGFLSGGIDSNAVADSMARAQGAPPVLCSVGFTEKAYDELDVARATAARLGAVHHTEVLEPDPRDAIETLPWFFDEPHADPSTLPTWLVSRVAREHVTVALSGDGGDETFAGYRRYVHDVAENRVRALAGAPGRAAARAIGAVYPKLDWAPRVVRAKTFLENVGADPAAAYWRSVSHMTREAAARLLAPDVARALEDHDPLDAFRAHYDRPEIDCPLYRAQYADFHTWLPDRILSKVDRASMGVSLEVRVPLLDHRFVERFAHIPAGSKVHRGRGKHALRESLRERLPTEVLDGKKRGFATPLERWTRGPLKGAIRDAIETLPDDWFDRARLRRVFDAHQSGRENHDRLLWGLLALEHWRRRHDVARLGA